VTFVAIDEKGTNMPAELYDTKRVREMPDHKKLAETQNAYLQQLSARRDNPITGQPEVQFTKEGKRAPSSTAPDDNKHSNKASRWH
jgi:hypothetical protein